MYVAHDIAARSRRRHATSRDTRERRALRRPPMWPEHLRWSLPRRCRQAPWQPGEVSQRPLGSSSDSLMSAAASRRKWLFQSPAPR